VKLEFDLGAHSQEDYFAKLATEHPLSGGSIANVARSATFLAAARGAEIPTITDADIQAALGQELTKIGDFRALMKSGAQS
jgi:hypothetical protein